MELVQRACELAEEGKTEFEIADILGVAYRTISNWKTYDSEFLHAIKIGKNKYDVQVEAKLRERANGFEYDEVVMEEFEFDGKRGSKKKVTRKLYPPEVHAQIFWLKNRQPENWRDKREYNITSGKNFAEWILEQKKKNEEEKK